MKRRLLSRQRAVNKWRGQGIPFNSLQSENEGLSIIYSLSTRLYGKAHIFHRQCCDSMFQ